MIKILPNIYLSKEFNTLNSNLESYGIDTVIIFTDNSNNILSTQKQDILKNERNDITIKYIGQFYPIDFDFLNNVIIDYLTYSKNLLIVSKNNLYGFTVISGFIAKILKIPLGNILSLGKYHGIYIDNMIEYQELLKFNNSLV